MKRKVLSGILVAVLMMNLFSMSAGAAEFIGSVFNKNNGVAISQEENRKPVIKTETGEIKEITVIPSETKEVESAAAVTQKERQDIVKQAESSIIITQSPYLDELLQHYTETETTQETTSKAAIEELVSNGVSVMDAVKTAAISTTVQQSSSVSEVLNNLSEEITSKVQENAKEEARKLIEVNNVKTETMQNALELAKEMMENEKRVDVTLIREKIAAQSEEKAAHFDKIIEKLEKKNVEITPEVIEKVIEKQQKHQEVLKDIQAGNVDQMKVHSVIDITVSDDIKAMTASGENYLEVSIEMPGVDEDTLVVAIKPLQDDEHALEAEHMFYELCDEMSEADVKAFFDKMGNRFIIVKCTPYDGGVTVEMNNFSPVLFLTYADQTTDVENSVEDMTEDDETEEVVAEAEDTTNETPMGLIAAVVAAVCGGAAVVMKKKKS